MPGSAIPGRVLVKRRVFKIYFLPNVYILSTLIIFKINSLLLLETVTANFSVLKTRENPRSNYGQLVTPLMSCATITDNGEEPYSVRQEGFGSLLGPVTTGRQGPVYVHLD